MVASLFGSVGVGFALPECPHDDSRNWHMCSQKRVGQRGVEGKDYSYLFVVWRRGEIKGKLKYRYFNGYKCTSLWTTQKQVGLTTYNILGGKVKKSSTVLNLGHGCSSTPVADRYGTNYPPEFLYQAMVAQHQVRKWETLTDWSGLMLTVEFDLR